MKNKILILTFITIIINSITNASIEDKLAKSTSNQSEETALLGILNKFLIKDLSEIAISYLAPDLILFSNDQNGAKLLGYLYNGNLDKTFGQNGVIKANVEYITSVLNNNGKILVLGSEKSLANDIPNTLNLACYNANGSLEESFGQSAFAQTKGLIVNDKIELAPNSFLALADNDNIIIYNASRLIKCDYNGKFDADFITHHKNFSKLALLDDKILLAYVKKESCHQIFSTIYIKQYFNNGQLDKKFGEDGILGEYGTAKVVTIRGDFDLKVICIQNDGKILISGEQSSHNLIFRCLANGDLDNNFGHEGYSKFENFSIQKMVNQKNGKILIAGTKLASQYTESVTSLKLTRLLANGLIDINFKANDNLQKLFKKQNLTSANDIANATIQILISNLGKIILGGTWANGIPFMFKFNDDGSFDQNFDFQSI